MVFITAGMGGGTGTGAAPVIARTARELGILTVGVVTKPFQFEGVHRMRIAEAGIEELQKYVDTLIIIPNQNLFRIANERTTFADAFKMADDVLHAGVRGVTDLMVMPGLINLDFADIRTVMSEMGKAMMGTGEADGERRAIDAAEAAINNPLLEDVSMKGARGVLINITGGTDMTLFEVDEAANRIREEVDPDANIIFGSTFDEKLAGRMRISVVATGIEAEAHQEQARAALAAARRLGTRAARHGDRLHAAGADAERGGAARRIGSTDRRVEAPAEPVLPAASAAESAAVRGGAFIAPRPVDPGPARPTPVAPTGGAVGRRRRPGGDAAAGARAEPDRARDRHGPLPATGRRPRRRAGRDPAGEPGGNAAAPASAAAGAARRAAPVSAEQRQSREEQGRGSARHPGLPAPPGELTGTLPRRRAVCARTARPVGRAAAPARIRKTVINGR